ncbi:hypothetical protein D9756_001749 [Leucocoprinus leucothites]|uniref:UFSP1/2/DUB catalytic domain-containing protein n=1 Tax=Leucocoprinus leucothites TaxID=201217 RepID=A0A8H5LHY2_9AGAR|nr:hypothetical protein D9756_001749 [Leucoagaricus leucothites]
MSDGLTCGFCSENLESLTLSQREDHYEAHFVASGCGSSADGVRGESSRRNASNTTAQRGKRRFQPNVREPWEKLVKKIENDVFWYPSLGSPPPRNYTPGLIPIIKQSLNTLCANGKVARAVLCHDKVVHISKELWDISWGCGYRNFLMLCTGLVEQEHQPLYFPLLDTSPTPSVRNLQSCIQIAWDDGKTPFIILLHSTRPSIVAGYDAVGRKELRSKIIGTNKWIGTAEIYVVLSHRGIPAELVDFNGFRDKESCGPLFDRVSLSFNLPASLTGAAAVIQWMVQYFTPDEPECAKAQSSSINNHRGHSRTIIGYQRDVDGIVNLLTFDTGRWDYHLMIVIIFSHEICSLLPFALRSLGRSPYGPLEHDEASSHGPGLTSGPSKVAMQAYEDQGVNSHEVPITLVDLLTPSETELAREQQLLPERPQESRDSSKKAKLMSHLKAKNSKKGKSSRGFTFQSDRKAEPDARQVQKAFKLTPKQLASKAEYQVLYVPLRAPLSENQKLDRKIVRGRRITNNSSPPMEL